MTSGQALLLVGSITAVVVVSRLEVVLLRRTFWEVTASPDLSLRAVVMGILLKLGPAVFFIAAPGVASWGILLFAWCLFWPGEYFVSLGATRMSVDLLKGSWARLWLFQPLPRYDLRSPGIGIPALAAAVTLVTLAACSASDWRLVAAGLAGTSAVASALVFHRQLSVDPAVAARHKRSRRVKAR